MYKVSFSLVETPKQVRGKKKKKKKKSGQQQDAPKKALLLTLPPLLTRHRCRGHVSVFGVLVEDLAFMQL